MMIRKIKKACIVLDVDGEILVLSAENDSKMRELYETILIKIRQRQKS